MTLIPIIDEFEELGRQIPCIVRVLEERGFEFDGKCQGLLKSYMDLAEKRNLHFAADIALILGKMLTYKDSGELLTSASRNQKRRAREAHILACVNEAYGLVQEYFAKEIVRLNECEGVFRQILAVAAAKGLLKTALGIDAENQLTYIWDMLRSDSELAPALTQIIGLAGVYNAKILLDKNVSGFLLEE